MSEGPYLVVARSLRGARQLYAKHAIGWTIVGGVAAFISAWTFTSATRFSGMAGGVAFALPVGLWMAWRWWSVRETGPLVRLVRDEPQRIVWTYVKIHTVHSRTGQEMRRTHEVAIGRDDGKKVSFYIDDRDLTRVPEALAEIAPHATTGWTEANEDLFADDPSALRRIREPEGGAYRDAPRPADAKPIRRGRRQRARRIRLAIMVGVPLALLVVHVGGALRVSSRTSEQVTRRAQAINDLFAVADREIAKIDKTTPVIELPRFETACAGRVRFPITVGSGAYETSPELRWKPEGGAPLASFRPGLPSANHVWRMSGDTSTNHFFKKSVFTLPWNWDDFERSWGDIDTVPTDEQLAVVWLAGHDGHASADLVMRIANRKDGGDACTGRVVALPGRPEHDECARVNPMLRETAAMKKLCEEGRVRRLVDGIHVAVLAALAATRQ